MHHKDTGDCAEIQAPAENFKIFIIFQSHPGADTFIHPRIYLTNPYELSNKP